MDGDLPTIGGWLGQETGQSMGWSGWLGQETGQSIGWSGWLGQETGQSREVENKRSEDRLLVCPRHRALLPRQRDRLVPRPDGPQCVASLQTQTNLL